MKEWFVLCERAKGNQNAFIMYAEGPNQTKEDRKEDKIRVSCMSNIDCTRIRYPPIWKDEGRVKTTLVAWKEDHTGAWELIEDRVPIDSYSELSSKARYMCVFVQESREDNEGVAYYASNLISELSANFAGIKVLGKEQRKIIN